MVITRAQAASRQGRAGSGHTRFPSEIGSSTASAKNSTATRSLETFQYEKLEDGSKDIRLVALSPGRGNDPVVVQIKHARLPEYPEVVPTSHERTLQKVAATLPPDWMVFETLEGRVIFANDEIDLSCWEHPGGPDLEVPVLTTTLDVPGTPDFEALSYTWGSPHSRKAVFVEDPSKPGRPRRKLIVTKNLSIALQHLRYPDRMRTLWVDAICINQHDIAERNAQVQRMPHLYRLARRTIVWLGPGSRQSKIAMSALHYLAEQVEVTRQVHTICMPGAIEKEWYHNDHDLPYDEGTWRAIHRLFQRVWFTRLWVVQEVNLAGTRAMVQCGDDEVPWAMFRRAVLCLSTKYNLPTQDIRGEIATIAGLANYDGAASYMGLTVSIFDRECSDQRDRIFGLLGLMPPGLRKRMPANYALEVGEVYKRATLAQIEHFGRLDVLHVCDDAWNDHRAITAPSWVPDLIMPPAAFISIRQQFSSGISGCAARQVGSEVLEVLGIRAATISTSEYAYSSFLGGGIEAVRTWQFPDIDSPYPCGGSFLDALAMILCSMKVQNRYPQQRGLPSFQEWKSYCQDVILDRKQDREENGRVSALYLSSMDHVLFQRTFFTTKEGHIGLGALGLEPGDVIATLLGYDVPMILRETSEGNYHVVGSALVYGLHDALSLLGPLPNSWTVQVYLDSVGDANLLRFLNESTGQVVDDDPRLPPLQGWERVDSERTGDDPEIFQKFRNLSTGEVINFDPRMSADELKSRGVALKAFRLV
ncbi:heterokaryon incompatibility protein-domain-containing protein [Cercophora newfieldiana]|uniref:Heterokaryon incompatibility protein-domain-containing protein n=1 Tax=Cercophora newfieldiana TaxID=92897 RepID=A0AA39Y476_9PEZI|nr:heterokaryon incompatibility protein-domain-containing protein [Cercophora newfieldiana]